MLQKVIEFLTPRYKQLKNRTVFGILFVLAFFIRFPFFFRDYIDRDESTFILIGQSWANGHLPFTELWDVKPPLTFLFFAAIIYIFGKSLLAIRFFGVVLVVVTSFFTYKIGSTVASKKIGFWAAMGSVILQSMFGSVQGVMSEHICMAFFMTGLYLLVRYKSLYTHFLSGLLFGVAVMVKLNIAYALLFLGIYISYQYLRKREFRDGIRNTVGYGLGILLIIGLAILPYYLNDLLPLWWGSVIEAPLDYAAARRNSPLKMAPIFVLLGLFFFICWRTKKIDFQNPAVQLLLVAIVGVLVSFIKGGRINGHYLIQLYPLLLVFVATAIAGISSIQKLNYRPYLFFIALLLPMESYLEYYNVGKNRIQKGRFFNGEGIDAPAYITKNKLSTKNILFLEYHIGYWVLDVNPPTKAATHPSNICKAEMFPYYDNPRTTSLEEIQYILEELQPKTIVARSNAAIFDKKLIEENIYINTYLAQHYTLLNTIDRALIYQRLE